MKTSFRFRKSVSLVPGLRLNFGKTGLTSVSVGGRGYGVTYGRKGARAHIGLPGTGLSFQAYQAYQTDNAVPMVTRNVPKLCQWETKSKVRSDVLFSMDDKPNKNIFSKIWDWMRYR